jgi:hypothetical protein
LVRAAKRAVGAFQRFAKGLRDDDDAIRAGVTRPLSHGPVEGQITRLKRLKRQMFGRASLVRLERRFVLAPGREPGPGQRPLELSEVQARPAAAEPPMPSGSWWSIMLLGATNAGREGLPSYMRQRIAPLVSPNVTKNGQEPNVGLGRVLFSLTVGTKMRCSRAGRFIFSGRYSYQTY